MISIFFLLWQIAYAEIYVTQTAWPDFREPELFEAFASFGGRERDPAVLPTAVATWKS